MNVESVESYVDARVFGSNFVNMHQHVSLVC